MNQLLKRRLSNIPFHKRLFYSIFILALLFVVIIYAFQYQREKFFREQMLNSTLSKYNTLVIFEIKKRGISDSLFNDITQVVDLPDLRLTIINSGGTVIYDNRKHDVSHMTNHLTRPEIVDAIKNGSGYSIRFSDTIEREYFYSAQKYGNLFIRTSLPYNTNTIRMLEVDRQFIYFLIVLFFIIVFTLFRYSQILGKSISRLREFVTKAEENLPIDNQIVFSNDDIGEISNKLVNLYKRLKTTKTALTIEQEKLYMHFRFSREGLAIFSQKNQEIFSNSLFIQQLNLISDLHVDAPEQVFEIAEFQSIISFIDTANASLERDEEVTSHKFSIRKSGRAFEIACIVFEDKTYEISIYDNTGQDEENRLKRQLTQNISHELKTPVSSIQGYLETILTMPDLDANKRNLFLERCFAQSKRLAYLLSDISLLNRMDESNTLFDIDSVDVSHIIREIVSETQHELEKKSITVDLIDIPQKALVEGNTSLIYSIFRNLIDNAGTYAGENVRVVINCYRQDANYYYFTFSDTGVGVADEHLNRLFERFYRVDKGRSRKIGGTGLGLAIVKNAVLFHKGEISAKNRTEGGLEFLFSLKKNQ
ncbi:MAG: ATP-binding protein [Bacteroidales bacterium]|nr:ATP-binding protein [Bacteroidales bacterium]